MLGCRERSWRPSWAIRGPVGAILGHLGRPDRSRHPPKISGRGGGGYASPKGKGFLEEERKISLDHLRPEGWWDSIPDFFSCLCTKVGVVPCGSSSPHEDLKVSLMSLLKRWLVFLQGRRTERAVFISGHCQLVSICMIAPPLFRCIPY